MEIKGNRILKISSQKPIKDIVDDEGILLLIKGFTQITMFF